MTGNPAYALETVQRLVRAGAFQITASARAGAAALNLGEPDIVRCVLALTGTEFHKTMESETVPGLWQDVYRPVFESEALYAKLQVAVMGNAVVISFKGR